MMNIYDISQARALQLLRIAAQEITEYNKEYAWQVFQGMGVTIPELQALDAVPEYTCGTWEYSDTNFRIFYEIDGPLSPVQLQEIADAAAAQWYDSDDGDGLPLPEYIEYAIKEAGADAELQDVKSWYGDDFLED